MSAAVEIAGYVEAKTATQVLGWAWAPATPGRRVTVQALLGEAVIAEATADRPRDDLARNGIGDGRHAFELPLPEAAHARQAELRVVARTDAGAVVSLTPPPQADGVLARLEHLQRAVDALVASQRVLHRNVQAALVGPKASSTPGPDGSPDIAAVQAQLIQQIAIMERFAMRLDERFATQPEVAAPASARACGLAFALAAVALAISVWGLWREWAL
jgi:hypothetical protein